MDKEDSLLLTEDQVAKYSIEDQLDLLPFCKFDDSNTIQRILLSPLFKSIFAYYKEHYFNDLLNSKTLIEQQLSTYLYLTGQDDEEINKIDNMLYWRYCPTIEEFINDDRWLGKLYKNSLYPYWKRTYNEIFAPDSAINKVIFSGSTSSGKSTAARIGILYAIYRILCLRNPRAVLNITKESMLSAFIISVNMKLAEKTNYEPFLRILENCECFVRTRNIDDFYTYGPEDPIPFMPSRSDLSIKFPNGVQFLIGSEVSHTVSHNIFASFCDEVSEKSSPIEIEKTLNLLNSIDMRLQNRFMGSNYIFQAIASSAKSNRSALAEYIKKVPKGPNFKIYNPRAWEIKSDSAFIGDGSTFPVLIGNGVIQSRIITSENELEEIKNGTFNLENGCEILDVPTIYRTQFEVNLTQALQDIAGVSTAEENLLLHDTSKLEDIHLAPEIHVEANLGENVKIIDLLPDKMFEKTNNKIQLARFPQANRYCHIDLAVSGGKSEAGISMCHKEYNIDGSTGEKQVFYVFDFVMWISALVRIDLHSIETFIYDLVKERNVRIDTISMDQFQSDSMRQSFELSGLFRKVLKLS